MASLAAAARTPLQRGAALRSGRAIRAPQPVRRAAVRRAAVRTEARAAKTQQLYICVDCGYIYDGSEGPFEKLPSSYRCPVCAAPKRRFKPYAGKAGKNDPKSMSARAQAMSRAGGASSGSVGVDDEDKKLFVYIAIGGAVALGALYFGLNSQF